MADGIPSGGFDPRDMSGSGWMARALGLIGALWRTLKRSLAGGYRPERHYMRGPGPKSLDRNSRTAA